MTLIPKINHDGNLDIATGRHRRESSWKNKQTLWSDLLKRLATTHRTAETFAEYITAKKPRQDEIKDIGGFVGGYLDKGKRRKTSVLSRQLVTLDADFLKADSSLWEDFKLYYNNAACVYSTHKHEPDKPRLRLILPLDREVMPDEYMAIARRLAGSIGIEAFDPTTYQPERLMYWPSTSKDGEYLFHYQDGPWISADNILATYHDWRDSSEWPMSAREKEIPLRAIKKQGDPLEKTGIVGAFCRTYSISEAIDRFLNDVYEKCDGTDDRYTYVLGSTAGGLVVYEDKYAYSHHGTDPTSGKLCNAFDLVRLHKFGLRDEGASDEKASFDAMLEFAGKDPQTSKTLSLEKLESAREDFAEQLEAVELETGEVANNDWLDKIEKDKKGTALSTIDNVVQILRNDPLLKGRLAYNQFEDREVALKPLPWRNKNFKPGPLVDSDDAGLRHYIEKAYGIGTASKIQDAVAIVVRENGFHPIRDYLNSVGDTWDGEERLDMLLIDYLGADDNLYVRTVTRKAFVAAVARVFRPGIKFDNMLIIVGAQGIGKSTIINKMGGKWFSDSFNFHMLSSKQGEEQLRGAWLIEVGELTGLSKTDVETAKSFLSRTEDRYRVAYGKRLDYFPRQNVFFGSTNNLRPLKDATGGRRFWPVVTKAENATRDVFKELTEDVIDQLWAEAMYLYRQGEPLILPEDVKAMAEEIQEMHTEVDEWYGPIKEYINKLLPERWPEMNLWDRRSWLQNTDELAESGTVVRTHVCAAEIWCELMGGTIKEMNRNNAKVIHDNMQRIKGWEMDKRNRRVGIYGTQKCYLRVNQKCDQVVTRTSVSSKTT